MELTASLPADTPLSEVPEAAQRAERLGFDTLHVSETIQDPFVTSTLALEHSEALTRMCELGGAVADGFVCHPTASHPAYLNARIRPALRAGASRPGAVTVGHGSWRTHGRWWAARRPTCTPPGTRDGANSRSSTARPPTAPSTLAHHKQWDALASHLTDEVLDELAPIGTWEELPSVLDDWYAGQCDGLSVELPPANEDGVVTRFVHRAKTTIAGAQGG